MHLGVVPITSDHKLSAKRLLDRRELKKLQAELPEYPQ
ncbi:plasmid recombination protein [Sporolactobacillus sp. KGMB 08714]